MKHLKVKKKPNTHDSTLEKRLQPKQKRKTP